MANSSFSKNNRVVTTPVTVPNGGTGKTSLNNKSVIIGTGAGSVGYVAPGISGNALNSNGTDWRSSPPTPGDGTITYAKLDGDLVDRVVVTTANIDWSLGSIYTGTLVTNLNLTFSNYKLNKVITLIAKGNYALKFPNTVKVINGTYNGVFTNYITLHCVKDTAPQEVWVEISQKIFAIPSYGYFGGGYTGVAVATTDMIVFSTGVTSSNTVSNLSVAKYSSTGVSDCSSYGYFIGGTTGVAVATTDRIIFSTGATSANTVSNLPTIRSSMAGVSDGSNYGYVAGAGTGVAGLNAYRIIFSTGVTSANTVSNLSVSRQQASGVSDKNLYGYFMGGYTASAPTAVTDRIVFSTGITSANTVSNLSVANYTATGVSDNSIYGYVAGGNTGVAVATTDRIIFSSGATSSNTVSSLSVARYLLSSSSDGTSYGYFAGGNTGALSSIADRIIFSTGTTSANTVSNLSQARTYIAGLSNNAV